MISDILPRYQEVANGSKKAFTVPFDTLDSSYINVYLNNTKQSSGYTVSNKVVTFTSAPANGTVVTVTRVVPIEWEQEVLGAINQDSLNKIFTKLVAQMQTLKEEVSRAVKTDVTDTESGNDHFLELLEDAIDSLELANTKLEQVIASGTQALSDIDSAKTGALAQIESKVDEAEGWAEKAEEYAESVNPENFDHLKGKISNCILEIPQRINAKIDNNILTLKSGSSMWYPNGNTYSEVSNSNDLTLDLPTTAGRFIVCMRFAGTSLFARNILSCVSGSGVTTTGGFAFDTDAKTIINYSGSGSAGGRYCAPFCLIDVVDGVASFAKDSNGNDMIFNGSGFIGHHAFVYPNVKGLSPNGRNTDGTLKSSLRNVSSLIIIELNQTEKDLELFNNTVAVCRYDIGDVESVNDLPNISSHYYTAYIKDINAIYYKNTTQAWVSQIGNYLKIASYNYNGTNVTQFDIRQPVRLATTEMLDKVQDQVDTNTTAISGKLDKVTTVTSGYQLYRKNPDGTQSMIDIVTGSAVGNSVPVRTSTGTVRTATPTADNDSATKLYVDEKADTQNGTISNCILEIPQNLKLTLENNTITLKSGSVLTHTGETYQTTTTTADTTWNNFNLLPDGRYVIFTGTTGNFGTPRLLSNITSGSSLPESATADSMFFNTIDKKIYRHDTGSWAVWNVAYPLAIVDVSNGVANFAKDSNGNNIIFNGIGFIGHHVFTYPQTRYLSGNSKNDDGTLASYDNTLNSLTISEMSTITYTGYDNVIVVRGNNNTVAGSSFWRTVKSYDELLPQSSRLQFVEDDNIAYAYTSGSYQAQSRIYLCTYEYDGTTVTKFDIRQPYEGARNLLTDDIEEQIEQNTADIATKADDSDVLHKTGNETTTGNKTFTGEIIRQMSSLDYGGIKVKNTVITKGTAPSTNAGGQFTFQDSTTGTSASSRVGGMEVVYDSSGQIINRLHAYKPTANSTEYASIEIHYKADGTKYATAPTPTEDTTSSNQIDTVGARNTKLQNYTLDSNAAHKTGNETIAGEKTLTDKFTVDDNICLTNNQNTYRHVFTDNSAITKGTAPSANTGTELILRDSNNVNIGSIATWYNTSGTICTALRAYNPTAGTTDSAVIQINYTADGKTYATAPTPAISDDSNKIATTEWFNDKLVLVNELPANPDSSVWYAIPEEE